jgi:hypothetical protein
VAGREDCGRNVAVTGCRDRERGGAVVWHVLVDRAPVGPLSEPELTAWVYAIVAIKRDPSKHGMGRAIFGIVMGALGTTVLCAMLLYSAL